MYRFAPFVFCVFPFTVLADDFEVPAPVTAVEVYPSGATVTRDIAISVPAGQHHITLTGLPSFAAEGLKIALPDGLSLIATQVDESSRPSASLMATPEIAAARAVLDRAMAQRDAIALIQANEQATIEAANAQLDFAKGLGQGDGELNVETLKSIADIIGQTVSAAVGARTAAEQRKAAFDLDLDLALRDVENARRALADLMPDGATQTRIDLTVLAQAPVAGLVQMQSFTGNAGWSPVYEVNVTTDAAPTFRLERKIGVTQSTGETWRDASMSFSTLAPSRQLDAFDPQPWLRQIFPDQPVPKLARGAQMDQMEMERAAAPLGIAEDVTMAAEVMGMDLRYVAPFPMTVTSSFSQAQTHLALDTLQFDLADMYAAAVPLHHETAILRATLKNTSSEILLPGRATFYRDGLLAGTGQLPLLVAGASEEIGLGEIRGLTLERRIADKMTGDTGVISKSNEQTEEATLLVTNQTDRVWDVRLMDRVPYSEQEDLKITWSADPMPSETDIDGKRGVLAWRKPVAAGEAWAVTLRHRIVWPENQVLQ